MFSLVSLMKDRQRIIDYTSFVSPRARIRSHDTRFFLSALAKQMILKQPVRFASKRLGSNIPICNPRHIHNVPAAVEHRLVQPRS